jgi:hypothetical protein
MLRLSNDIRRRVEDVINQPFEKVNKNLLMSLHREVFSCNYCVTCKSEQILAYIELTRLIRPKKMSNTPSKKYKFSPSNKDAIIHMPKKRWKITAETLTDEQARFLIKSEAFKGLIVEIKEPKKKPLKKD